MDAKLLQLAQMLGLCYSALDSVIHVLTLKLQILLTLKSAFLRHVIKHSKRKLQLLVDVKSAHLLHMLLTLLMTSNVFHVETPIYKNTSILLVHVAHVKISKLQQIINYRALNHHVQLIQENS